MRQRQSQSLAKAKGRAVVAITARGREEKYILDKAYFEELLAKLSALRETLEIAADPKLLERLLKTSRTLARDLQHGRLHTLEEAFGGK
jgi:PHD/YefM family antitoxin component YafN of YafNO toxin-antitoxin module